MTAATNDVSPPAERAIVLDSAALIAGTDNLYALGGLIDPESGLSPPNPAEACNVRFYVTPDVAIEVRDARARARLAALDRLGVIEQKVPSAEAVATVAQFAKATGDYAVLSMTDLRVMALCWMLEVERNGTKYLNDEPVGGAVTEIRKARGIKFEEVEKWEHEEKERLETEQQNDDGWTTVDRSKPAPVKKGKKKRKNRKKPRKIVEEEQRDEENVPADNTCTAIEPESPHENKECDSGEMLSAKVNEDIQANPLTSHEQIGKEALEHECQLSEGIVTESSSVNEVTATEVDLRELREICDEIGESMAQMVEPSLGEEVEMYEDVFEDDDGQGWINEENLEEHLARDRGAEDVDDDELNRVACVTTDFAMQNTMLQMGLKILSVDGRRTIRKIKHFALRCHSCGEVTRELQRKFCGQCGNACFHRVAFKVDKKGVARAFFNPKKKPILRGTKYPIPLPRGGRHNKDLILCEDQIDPVKQRRLQKQRERLNVDVLDPSNFYNAGARFNPHDRPLVVGYGRRNPNEVRASGKGKKKR